MRKKINGIEQKKLKDKIFFKKFKTVKVIAVGGFGCVFEGLDLIKKEKVAIKIEKKSNINYLESECCYLVNLKGYGIPKVISFGISGNYYVLVEEGLGKSLDMITKEEKKICVKDLCMIAIQILDRLEYIHSKYVIHRDIKPGNFLIGDSNPTVIYLIDFGFAKKYRSSLSKKHLQYKNHNYVSGSINYASINANLGLEQSRRDDLEALGYSLIYMANGNFPWKIVDFDKNLTLIEKINKICEMKKELKLEKLCENLPKQLIDYFKYCRNLRFEQEPDYKYLQCLFKEALMDYNYINDLNFFWIKKDSQNKTSISSEKKKGTTTLKRKTESFRNRLFRKISDSAEKMKRVIKENKSEEHDNIKHEKNIIDKNIKLLNKKNQTIKEKITIVNNTGSNVNKFLKSYIEVENSIISNKKKSKLAENKDINDIKENITDIQQFQNIDKIN